MFCQPVSVTLEGTSSSVTLSCLNLLLEEIRQAVVFIAYKSVRLNDLEALREVATSRGVKDCVS